MCVVCVQELELYFTEPRQLLDMFGIIMLHSSYTCVSCVFRSWNYTVQSPDSCLTYLTSLCYIVHIHVCRVCSGAGIILYRARQLLDMFDIIMFDIIMLHSSYTCVSCVFRSWNYTLQSPDSCLTCLTSLCYIVHIHVCRVCSGAGIILYRAPTAA